jgi:tetratricopeptide (TPR) repeat protein
MKKSTIIIALMIAWFFVFTGNGLGNSLSNIPFAVTIMLNKAQHLADQGKIDEAVSMLTSFQNKKKGYSHYYIDYALGNYFLMLSKPKKALVHYKAAITQNKKFSDALLNLAKCHYDLNHMKKAGSAFLKGYETSSVRNAKHLYYSATCYAASDEYQTAYSVFKRLLRKHPEKFKLKWKETLVQVLLALKKQAEALPYIEELADKLVGKKQKEWREILLYQYMSMKMENKAFSYVKWLTKVDTLEPKWWKGLAHLHLMENRYSPALAALTVKGFLEPLTAQEQRIAADLNMTLDVPVQAILFYEKIAGEKFEPDMAYRIAQGYIRLHRPEDALNCVEKGLIKEENNLRLMLLKGDLLYGLERYSEAAAAFETVARGKENPGGAWLMAGYAAWNAGDLEKSRLAFKHAAKYPEQKNTAQKALCQLELILQ